MINLSCPGLRVMVTGAATGIGRAIAALFFEHGANVHICDNSAERLAAFQQEFPEIGTTLADVSNVDDVNRFFADAISRMEGLDVLVNNAGIAGPTAMVEDISPADWQKTIEVCLNGAFYCTRKAVPYLKANPGGSIINISSTAGQYGFPLRTPYASAKWALIGFTKTLAMELGEFGIRVNAICPGSVDGPRMDRVIAAEATARNLSAEEVRVSYYNQTSLRTFVDAKEIANIALFISTDLGKNITGQALAVDGNTETLRTIR